MRLPGCFTVALCAAGLAAAANAQIVIDPVSTAGAVVPVTGRGVNANGYVELFVNGASRGSVQADATGAWSKTVGLSFGDVLTAIPARVWNFNTDGDAEGWFSPGNSPVVTGGVLNVTQSAGAGSNLTLAFNGTGLVDPNVLRVLEIGYRYEGAVAPPGVVLTNSNNGGPLGPSWTPTPAPSPSAGFRSDLVDLSATWGANQTVTPNLGWTGTVNQIGFGFNGASAGNTFALDFVRLRETFRFDFPYDGDTQGMSPGPNSTITGVADGVLTAGTQTTNASISVVPSFQNINPNVYSVYNAKMIQNSDAALQPAQITGVGFYYGGWTGYAPGFAQSAVYPASYGNPVVATINLAGVSEWNQPQVAINLGNDLMYAPQATDSVQVDYIEFAPATVIGDAAPVTVGGIVIPVAATETRTQSQAGYPLLSGSTQVVKTGGGTLVFDAGNTSTGPTVVSAGTLEVANANAVASSAVTVSNGATLAVASGITMKAPSVTVNGGTLSADSVAVNSATGVQTLTINSGTLAATTGLVVGAGGLVDLPDQARVAVGVASLVVDQGTGGGKVDLGAGQVSIAAGGISAADLRADIIAGLAGGSWNGPTGITSGAAAAAGGTRAVGYVVEGSGAARVSFAAPGDTNLDGVVDLLDLLEVLGSNTYETTTPSIWAQGDFNYDGFTDLLDLLAILGSNTYDQGNYFPATASSAGGLAAPAPVPEPGMTGLLLASAASVMLRRRRRR
ncbi:MAG: autotransporter-associated beta strand repeat-containing protein [Planctomycetota bacterium]